MACIQIFAQAQTIRMCVRLKASTERDPIYQLRTCLTKCQTENLLVYSTNHSNLVQYQIDFVQFN